MHPHTDRGALARNDSTPNERNPALPACGRDVLLLPAGGGPLLSVIVCAQRSPPTRSENTTVQDQRSRSRC
jgi:hypothetical protein